MFRGCLRFLLFSCWAACLLLMLVGTTALQAAVVTIDFEDKPVGTPIRKHYLANYGVSFDGARICKPVKGTSSGKQALTHATGLMEFSPDPLTIRFEGPQSRVRLAAGLNNAPKKALKATMTAYDAQGKELTSLTKSLGPGPTAIKTVFEINQNDKKIRKVQLKYASAYFEVIDDLEFDNPVKPPADTKPPIVQITKPHPNQKLHSALFELRGTIQEDEGLQNLRVTIKPNKKAPSVFGHFDYDASKKPITFGGPAIGNLSVGENKITVTAIDIGNNKGSASVIVEYYPPAVGLRKLGVYSLSRYEDDWKGGVYTSSANDPYRDFWDFMVNGSGAYSVDKGTSERFLDKQVNITTVLPIAGDKLKSWEDFDLVFFYGHNNTIVPPDTSHDFTCYLYQTGQWVDKTPCNFWGTPGMPFDYYAFRPIKNGAKYPGALTYLYNKYTASLLGDPYDYGGGEPEGNPQSYRVKWSDKAKTISYAKLGSQNLKWLILHGCQAVITAKQNGNYLNLGVKAFSEIYDGYHMILGHYHSFYVSQLTPLGGFAKDLISGVPIQTAYFDTDPDTNTSAIAAEESPFQWSTSMMANDNWLAPMTAPASASVFSQRWVVSTSLVGKKP